MAAPILAAPGPPSCAGTAARRCSSSRPLRALSTSVARRVPRSNHDRHRINQQNHPGGICLNDAVANARGLVLQNVALSARQASLERSVPLRAWLATDTLRSRSPVRSRSPDDLRLTGFYRRSNPHRSATLLIGISTTRGFLPGGLSSTCPHASPGLDPSAHTGWCRTTLNRSSRRETTAIGKVIRTWRLSRACISVHGEPIRE